MLKLLPVQIEAVKKLAYAFQALDDVCQTVDNDQDEETGESKFLRELCNRGMLPERDLFEGSYDLMDIVETGEMEETHKDYVQNYAKLLIKTFTLEDEKEREDAEKTASYYQSCNAITEQEHQAIVDEIQTILPLMKTGKWRFVRWI